MKIQRNQTLKKLLVFGFRFRAVYFYYTYDPWVFDVVAEYFVVFF